MLYKPAAFCGLTLHGHPRLLVGACGDGLGDSDVIDAPADVADTACVFHQAGGAAISCYLPEHVSVSVLKTVRKSRDVSCCPGFHLLQNQSGASNERSVCWD